MHIFYNLWSLAIRVLFPWFRREPVFGYSADTDIAESFYVRLDINGTVVTYQNECDGYTIESKTAKRKTGDMLYAFCRLDIRRTTSEERGRRETDAMRFEFVKFHERVVPDTFLATVGTGMLPITEGGDGVHTPVEKRDRVAMSWVDGTGTEWNSIGGDGGIIVIDSHELIKEWPSMARIYKTTGTFSCRLYNRYSHSVEVRNASFALRTVEAFENK